MINEHFQKDQKVVLVTANLKKELNLEIINLIFRIGLFLTQWEPQEIIWVVKINNSKLGSDFRNKSTIHIFQTIIIFNQEELYLTNKK